MVNIKSISSVLNHTFEGEMKMLVDHSGKIIDLPSNQPILGLSKGKNVVSLFLYTLADFTESTLESLVRDNIGFEAVLCNDIAQKWYRVFMSPLGEENGNLLLIQFIDITKAKQDDHFITLKRKSLETEMMLRTKEILQTEQAMLNQGGFLTNFLRGLRHDLISPITQLKEIINYFMKADEGPKKERAAMLIYDTLNKLSRTSEGFSEFVDLHFKMDQSLEMVSFEECYADIKAVLDGENHTFDITYDVDFSGCPGVFFNKRMVNSILYNLISNAIKFRSDERQLKIGVKTFMHQDQTVLEISDNGIGIDVAKNEHLVFAPFKRINNNRPGVGIGLSLVRSILLKDNRGKIGFESTENVGSTFRVKFNKLK